VLEKIKFTTKLKMFWSLIYIFKYDKFMKKEAYLDAYFEINNISQDVIEIGFFRYSLYKGYAAFQLGSYDETLLLFEESISLIHIAYSRNMINNDERDFLKEYAFGFLITINKVDKEFVKVDLYTKELQKLEYDIRKIRNGMFYDFPFLIGDKWDNERERR